MYTLVCAPVHEGRGSGKGWYRRVHYTLLYCLATQVGQEYEIQRIVKRDSCIPVPEVLHLSTAAEEKSVGAKFMVMKFVEVNS